MERRAVLRGVVTALTAAVAGCTGGGPSQPTTATDAGVVRVQLVDYEFDPGTNQPLEIPAGTTVRFVWKTGGHNIHVDSQPAGADWSGHEPIEGVGFATSHTFTVKGQYHFWCVPHRSLGMVGDVTVT